MGKWSDEAGGRWQRCRGPASSRLLHRQTPHLEWTCCSNNMDPPANQFNMTKKGMRTSERGQKYAQSLLLAMDESQLERIFSNICQTSDFPQANQMRTLRSKWAMLRIIVKIKPGLFSTFPEKSQPNRLAYSTMGHLVSPSLHCIDRIDMRLSASPR